jgi:hypothetical protein
MRSPYDRLFGIELLPAVYLMAHLDVPAFRAKAEPLAAEATRMLESLRPVEARSQPGKYRDAWLDPQQVDMFRAFASQMGLKPLPNGWGPHQPEPAVLAAACFVSASRLFVAWRSTKNAVWTRPGGVAALQSPIEAALAFLSAWQASTVKQAGCGKVLIACTDVRSGDLEVLPDDVALVVSSPPYANGHNYLRQWGPESAVADALGMSTKAESLIGVSTRISRPTPETLSVLPEGTQTELEEIRRSDIKDSATYYYRRFASYALGMRDALENIDRLVSAEVPRAIFVVRDTTHGDSVFRTGRLISDVLARLGWQLVDDRMSVVRSHIGNRRRSSARLTGRAQLEHTLEFERAS